MNAQKAHIQFRPFDKQLPPVLSNGPIVAVVSGARGGKTQLGAFLTAAAAIEQERFLAHSIEDRTRAGGVSTQRLRRRNIDANEPFVIGVGAPTFPMLMRVILPTVLRYIPDELKVDKYHETKKLLRVHGLQGESHIYFISARFWESWYGLKLFFAWVDEFALIKEGMYDELQTRLSDAQGRLLLTGTPQGPNWAHERLYIPWRDGTDRWGAGGNIDFHSWTTLDNPYLDANFIEKKRETMPRRYFDRTFLATWDTFEGQVYEEFLREVHVKKRENFTFHLKNGMKIGNGKYSVYLRTVIAGVDWGYGDAHPGVILVIGVDMSQRWYILEESVAERVLVVAEPTVDSWVGRARNLQAKWGIENFFCDTEKPEAIAQFRRNGLKSSGAMKAILPGIETVARYLHVDEISDQPHLVVMDTCKKTIDEFVYYHWKEGKEKPEKVNDHTMDALRYAMYTFTLRGAFVREPEYGKSTIG